MCLGLSAHLVLGRKLRCNGVKPSCYNCTLRNADCRYDSAPRRRGPGKAKKGSRSKKIPSNTRLPESSLLQPPKEDEPWAEGSPTMSYDYDYLDTEIRTELHPRTSVMSMDTFTFQPPENNPAYPMPPREFSLQAERYYIESHRRPKSERSTDEEDPS